MSSSNGIRRHAISSSNGAERPVDQLVVVRVDDEAAAGHGGHWYESPPQPREQALALVRLLLGYTAERLDDACGGPAR